MREILDSRAERRSTVDIDTERYEQLNSRRTSGATIRRSNFLSASPHEFIDGGTSVTPTSLFSRPANRRSTHVHTQISLRVDFGSPPPPNPRCFTETRDVTNRGRTRRRLLLLSRTREGRAATIRPFSRTDFTRASPGTRCSPFTG